MDKQTETIHNLVEYLSNFDHKDPEFWIDGHNLGRGINRNQIDQLSTYKIEGNELVKQNQNGVFYDNNSYLIEADITLTKKAVKQTIYFHWKGMTAAKGGHSPLPQNTQASEHPIVHRICQWSEPPAFFHLFPTPLIVFSDMSNKRDTHLFIIRGEIDNERHLYEIPNNVNNVRSNNASYLLVAKQRKCLYTNYANIGSFKVDQWDAFDLKIVKNYEFLNFLDGEPKYSISFERKATPKLFYFINLSGDYYLTLIEYSLRKQGVVVLFPFLQTHLYTASQPAIFILDDKMGNLWLWRGWMSNSDDNSQEFDKDYEIAKRILKAYIERQKTVIRLWEISAKAEPHEFKYLFPIWDENC